MSKVTQQEHKLAFHERMAEEHAKSKKKKVDVQRMMEALGTMQESDNVALEARKMARLEAAKLILKDNTNATDIVMHGEAGVIDDGPLHRLSEVFQSL